MSGSAFASELRALRTLPGVDLDIDPAAATALLRWSFIPHPNTIYSGVHQLRPGGLLEVQLEQDRPRVTAAAVVVVEQTRSSRHSLLVRARPSTAPSTSWSHCSPMRWDRGSTVTCHSVCSCRAASTRRWWPPSRSRPTRRGPFGPSRCRCPTSVSTSRCMRPRWLGISAPTTSQLSSPWQKRWRRYRAFRRSGTNRSPTHRCSRPRCCAVQLAST